MGEIEQVLPAGATVGELLDALTAQYPVLVPYAGFIRVAVNRVYAGREAELHDGDEVAWLPPVGGG
ncbi:MAG: MoaD/ThiS family protein [Anaerolineae bacterium]|nr:MoaD/ThiS family protein [Anaerolineae bacterium]MDH7475059.1 MoaD/ThiS family protein [Anaerolineae bacterium]